MISIVIATYDSERALVATLAALVPGATAGLVKEVIVADGGSRDETEQVADIAGCEFIASEGPLSARLNEAAAMARGEWLMFLAPGVAPSPAWIDEVSVFMEHPPTPAAVFALGRGRTAAWLRDTLGLWPQPDHGLILRRSLYIELGGHTADARDTETDLLRRIGRRRITRLRTAVSRADI